MPTTALMPLPKQQFMTVLGTPLVGGKVYTYAAGTTDPKVTYTDSAGTTPQGNPITLNLRGEPPTPIYWSGNYRVDVRDALNNLIYSVDNFNTDPAGIWGVLSQSLAQLAASSGSSLIGFIQAGAGAVLRTLQAKARDTVSPADFGAKLDGVADDQPGIQRAINYIQANFSSGTVQMPSGSTVKMLSGVTIDTNKCAINWNGSLVDCTAFTAGMKVYTITQSAVDVNRRPALNRAHPLRGAVYIGPGKGVAGCSVANLVDASASQVIAGVTFKDGGAWGWEVGLTLGQGSFFSTVENFDWAAVTGTDMGVCIDIINAANSGEKNMFINNRFGSADLYLRQGNGNADTHLMGCSFNYAKRMMYINAGAVYLTDYHIEGNDDTDNWFLLYGSNSILSFSQGVWTVAGNKVNKSLIYCDSTVTHGGVFLSQYALADASTMAVPIVSGTGRVQASHMSNYAVGAQPVTSAMISPLAYGDFESANYTSEWALSGPTPPARAAGTSHSGTYALRFAGLPGTPGQNNIAQCTVPCKPGQLISVDMWAGLTGYGTGGNFYGTWGFLDKGGNAIGPSGAPLNLTANTSFTLINFGAIPTAPPGAVSFQITATFFGVTAGTPFGYIDDVIINII